MKLTVTWLSVVIFLYGSSALCHCKGLAEMNLPYKSSNNDMRKTELQKFASWFHQDWKIIFPDFHQGARIYLDSISATQRSVLKAQLQLFIKQNEQCSSDDLKKAWLQLGAQAWQSDLDIRTTLCEFLQLM